VPSTPGFVGPFHFFCQQALASQGVGLELGLSAAIAIHLAFYIPVTSLGCCGTPVVWGRGRGNARLARRARQASQGATISGVPIFRLEALPPRVAPTHT